MSPTIRWRVRVQRPDPIASRQAPNLAQSAKQTIYHQMEFTSQGQAWNYFQQVMIPGRLPGDAPGTHWWEKRLEVKSPSQRTFQVVKSEVVQAHT